MWRVTFENPEFSNLTFVLKGLGASARYRVGLARDEERYQQTTRRAIEHFEGELAAGCRRPAAVWYGNWPYGERLTTNTLLTYLAALVQWNQQRGFADSTKAPHVRATLPGIQALHPQPVKQTPALQL